MTVKEVTRGEGMVARMNWMASALGEAIVYIFLGTEAHKS